MNNEYVYVSSRIRLARNVEGVQFPTKLSDGGIAVRIADGVAAALNRKGNYRRYDIRSTSPLDAAILQENHLISPDLIKSKFGTALIEDSVSVMVNEEDHIREQVILPGLSLSEAYTRANAIDDEIFKDIKPAFSKQYGYLTSCATNLGTGLRASVMMFLPALTMTGKIRGVITNLTRMHMTVRGVYGEETQAQGFLYQISNQYTLGVTEAQIVSSVTDAARQLAEYELKAREVLKNDLNLKNAIFRAYGNGVSSWSLTSGEAIDVLAKIRLGVFYGYFKESRYGILDELMTNVQPASIQKLTGAMDEGERDRMRAQYLEKQLKENISRE